MIRGQRSYRMMFCFFVFLTERPVWPKVLPAVLVPVVLLGAVVVVLLYRVTQREKLMTGEAVCDCN